MSTRVQLSSAKIICLCMLPTYGNAQRNRASAMFACRRRIACTAVLQQHSHVPLILTCAQATIAKETPRLTPLSLQVDFACVCRDVSQAVLEVLGDQLPSKDPIINVFWTRETIGALQMLQWAEGTINLELQIRQSVNAALQSSRYCEVVRTAFDGVCHYAPHRGGLQCLATFQDTLHGELSDLVTQALLAAKPVVDELARASIQQLLGSAPLSCVLEELKVCVSRCIVRHVVEYVKTKPIVLPKMHEDKQVAQQRADLVQKLANLDEAAFKIKSIEKEFVNDNYEGEVLQSILDAAKALEPEKMPAAIQQDAMSGPSLSISTALAAIALCK